MPWCDACNRRVGAEELGEGDTCPTCQRQIDTTPTKAPWHFKLLLGSLTVYLGWRAWQGIGWVIHRF